MSDDAAFLVPSGFRASGVKSGVKESGSLDLAAIVCDRRCAAAGTFTTNRIAAAPVRWDRRLVPSSSIRAVVINSGNANAATGALGLENAERTARRAAGLLACAAEDVLVASTGIIGRQLPMDKIEAGTARAIERASADPSSFLEAAKAIMTTDTRPKIVFRSANLGGSETRLLGFAKGAAMIGPRMATMLGFLLTDARVAPADLDRLLKDAVEDSFNCVSVEGHTSTNDTVLSLASGGDDRPLLRGGELETFAGEVRAVCVELARMIADDGEGATHLISIEVEGCEDRESARSIARAVADSPLVKTAIHGADPNWGRIVSAAGYSGVLFEETDLSLRLNGVSLYERGVPQDFDAAAVSADLRRQRETSIRLSLRQGNSSIRFYTCDLTAEYIRLNADYTT